MSINWPTFFILLPVLIIGFGFCIILIDRSIKKAKEEKPSWWNEHVEERAQIEFQLEQKIEQLEDKNKQLEDENKRLRAIIADQDPIVNPPESE